MERDWKVQIRIYLGVEKVTFGVIFQQYAPQNRAAAPDGNDQPWVVSYRSRVRLTGDILPRLSIFEYRINFHLNVDLFLFLMFFFIIIDFNLYVA